MTQLIERIEKLWCETMHSRTMWPIHGKYRCAECLREYKVAFDFDAESRSRGETDIPDLRVAASEFTRPGRQVVTL
jgi:hypothetical protein